MASRKILMLVENDIAPADTRVWCEAEALRDQGFLVSVISPKGKKQHRESYIFLENIHVYRYELPTVRHKYLSFALEYSTAMLITFWLSLKILFRHGFDVIHVANPPDTFFLLGLFYRLLGKKFVFDQHDITPEVFWVKLGQRMKPLHRLLLFLEWCSYRTADLVIVVNTSLKMLAIKRGRVPAERVFIVRNGPDLEKIKPVPPEPELKHGKRYLLAYIGVMAKQDGVEYALYMMEYLVYILGRHDVCLVLMGDGEAAEDLHRLCRELNLDNYVHFTGWVEYKDILRYLSTADIGLSPDPKNGLSEYCSMIKTMEYMALGKPVVAFDLAETRISAQDAALYAIPNEVADLAEKVALLLDDEQQRLRMGAIGQKRIREELSWEHDRKNLLLAYEKLFS